MIKIGRQEKYLLIFTGVLICVMILASAGLEIAKQNENEAGAELLIEGTDDVPANSNVSIAESSDDTLNTSSITENEQSTEPLAEQVSDNSGKITVGISALLEYVTPEEMSNRSDVILIGTVKEILPCKWNTVDGERPTDDIYDLGRNDLIYTDVVVSVDQYLKNPLSEKEVIVRTQGGGDGYVIMDVEDEPSFASGEKVLLYLTNDTYSPTKDFGPEHFVVTGVSQGKFTLTDDGRATQIGESLSLDELLDTI
ncbi:hypothetical protein SAMN04488587_1635 [Methanococcoides vulcani]|uniref:Uncharacterized protein n=1 Tax=Methanococcoides vulcani TaxID=1353158 RepID=A0A1I0AFG2_9EURY|nr:hypothetical protein [Methanococcoides vulcani]SES92979.1 hypothetical protein SAMN04488587_1635 [Methanococcoides vulcani]